MRRDGYISLVKARETRLFRYFRVKDSGGRRLFVARRCEKIYHGFSFLIITLIDLSNYYYFFFPIQINWFNNQFPRKGEARLLLQLRLIWRNEGKSNNMRNLVTVIRFTGSETERFTRHRRAIARPCRCLYSLADISYPELFLVVSFFFLTRVFLIPFEKYCTTRPIDVRGLVDNKRSPRSARRT